MPKSGSPQKWPPGHPHVPNIAQVTLLQDNMDVHCSALATVAPNAAGEIVPAFIWAKAFMAF